MYLIIGGNGFLGSYLVKNILEFTNDRIIATGRNINNVFLKDERLEWVNFDVDNFSADDLILKKIGAFGNDVKVVYLAANHHPDVVASNPCQAWNTNITSLSKFINTLPCIKCFFYPSTDVVYGGSKNHFKFSENSILNPINIYGKQKVVAEAIVNGYGYNVLRFPAMIGPSLLPHKKQFYDVILESLRQNQKIEMFSDQYKSFIDFDSAANLVVKIAERYDSSMPKILNVSGDEELSKYEVGCMIADKYKLSPKCLCPISISKPNSIFSEPRAAKTILDNSLLKKVLGIQKIHMKV